MTQVYIVMYFQKRAVEEQVKIEINEGLLELLLSSTLEQLVYPSLKNKLPVLKSVVASSGISNIMLDHSSYSPL